MAGIGTSQGIGTGEAQVFKTPMLERAIYNQQKLGETKKLEAAKARAKTQEQLDKDAEDLAKEMQKMDFTKVWQGDIPRIYKKYNDEVKGAYAEYQKATSPEERMAAKQKYREAQMNTQLDIQESIDKKESWKKGAEMIAASKLGELDDNEVNQWKSYTGLDSKTFDPDITRLRKKPDPADIVKLRKDLVTSAIITKPTSFGEGKIGDTDVIVTSNGQYVGKGLFKQNASLKARQEPQYAETLVSLYKEPYIKSGGKADDANGFLNYALDQEFETLRATGEEDKRSASQKGDNFNYTPNSGGGTYLDNFGYTSDGNLTLTKNIKTPGAPTTTTDIIVPIGKQRTLNLDYTSDFSNGVFNSSGDFVQESVPRDVQSSRVVQLPVVISKDGRPVVVNSKVKTSYKDPNGQIVTTERISDVPKSGVQLMNVLVVEDKKSKEIFYQPLDQIPTDKIQKADSRVLNDVASWSGQSVRPAKSSENNAGYSKDQENGISAFMKAQKIDRNKAIQILVKAGKLPK